MAGIITGLVLERYPRGGSERMVAVALADNAHRDGTHIFPSVADLAARCMVSERTVQVCMARMVSTGWLTLTRKSSGRRGDTNEYRISPEWIDGGTPLPPAAPVLRTNAKRANPAEPAPKPWGAETAPHRTVDNPDGWGEAGGAMGCSPACHGVKRAAPKPSGTVKGTTPLPPEGGAAVDKKSGTDGFECWWSVWPRREGEAAARRAWAKVAPSADQVATMVQAVLAQKQRPSWQRDAGQFVPMPSKWLAGRRWLDDAVPGAVAGDWHATRSGIEGRGQALGLGRWDEAAFQSGQGGEPFARYSSRVLAAAAVTPNSVIKNEGVRNAGR